jgi:quercetin dioxygenase-like cupin family protein
VGSEIVHVGSVHGEPPEDGLFGPPLRSERGVHVVGHDDAHLVVYEEHALDHRGFAESRCPTCRINFFRVAGSAGYRTPSHLHSQDEIIHVLEGELQVGRATLGPGTSIAVPGHTRYGFTASSDFAFLNYRRDASWVQLAPGSPPELEGEWPEWVPEASRHLS